LSTRSCHSARRFSTSATSPCPSTVNTTNSSSGSSGSADTAIDTLPGNNSLVISRTSIICGSLAGSPVNFWIARTGLPTVASCSNGSEMSGNVSGTDSPNSFHFEGHPAIIPMTRKWLNLSALSFPGYNPRHEHRARTDAGSAESQRRFAQRPRCSNRFRGRLGRVATRFDIIGSGKSRTDHSQMRDGGVPLPFGSERCRILSLRDRCIAHGRATLPVRREKADANKRHTRGA
jgi:hypothetical protein